MKILEQIATKLVATQAATDFVRIGELSAYGVDNESHLADYASIRSAKEAAFDTSSSDTVTANAAQIASNTAAFNSAVTGLETLVDAENNDYSFAEAKNLFDAESTLLSDAITAATATIDGHRSTAEANFGTADVSAVIAALEAIIPGE
tara:strand:- start:2498 stop:2944 length:447 start_codon:yes stop_codon:yes gene_type:complete